METVVVAIISVVGGAVASYIPLVLVTERTRRLRAVQQEQQTLNGLTDDKAKQSMTTALRESAERYADWATETKAERARRQTSSTAPTAIAFIVVLVPAALFARYVEDDHRQGVGLLVGALVAALYLLIMVGRVGIYNRMDRHAPTEATKQSRGAVARADQPVQREK